jgi:hypothetical protein
MINPGRRPGGTLMTHESPDMTQRYAHLKDDALRQTADLAGDIINDAINQNCTTIDPIAQKLNNG